MKITLFVVILSCSIGGCAASTVIYPSPQASFKIAPPAAPAWLADDPYDHKNYEHGYIRVSATIDRLGKVACITPGKSNSFHRDRVDIALTAIPRGFAHVEEIEIPLYEKHLVSDKRNQCVEPTASEVLIVPNSVVQSNQPQKITLVFRYSGDREEAVSSQAAVLLGVASALTTGGAAQTIAGFTNLASSNSFKNVGDYYKSLTSSSSLSPVEQVIHWEDLTAGKNEIRIPIWQTETKQESENASTAAADAYLGGRTKDHLFDVVFHISFQRSLFGQAPVLPLFIPDRNTFTDDDVLQFPPGSGVSTLNILQKLNAKTPTLLQSLGQSDPEVYSGACREIRSNVDALKLAKYDRAIVMAALLNTARPGWNKDSKFVTQCLQPYRNYVELINVVYDKLIPNFPVDVANYKEIAEGENSDWTKAMGPLLEELSFSFKQNQEVEKVRLLNFIDASTKISAEPLDWDPISLSSDKTQEQRLSELAKIRVRNIGCFIPNTNGVESGVYKGPSGAFVLRLDNGHTYTVSTDFDKNTKKLSAISFTIFDVGGSFHQRIIGSRYPSDSSCVALFKTN
ncbi:hypothetical protein [Collimonas silvisoli]|uniref:hypothetical protein n=1 Tax=Collimonas silvisoli TaxID=2825884 RepID=UPI001B8C8558|nr:hypothetical protein [Collimonas silvisoli]